MRGTRVRASWSRSSMPHPGTEVATASRSPQASLTKLCLACCPPHSLSAPPSACQSASVPQDTWCPLPQQDAPALTYSSSLSHNLSLQGKGLHIVGPQGLCYHG